MLFALDRRSNFMSAEYADDQFSNKSCRSPVALLFQSRVEQQVGRYIKRGTSVQRTQADAVVFYLPAVVVCLRH